MEQFEISITNVITAASEEEAVQIFRNWLRAGGSHDATVAVLDIDGDTTLYEAGALAEPERTPKVGDKATTWDPDEHKRVGGTVSHVGEDGYVIVRCVDGIDAEYPDGSLRWDGQRWLDPDIFQP